MAKYRQGRINESVALEVSLILRDVKDPRVSEAMITVTGADVTADLKYAKIFYSLYDGDEKEIRKGLRSAAPFIRSQLAKRLNLRMTPELTFVKDDSAKHGVEIAAILGKLNVKSDAEIAAITSSDQTDGDGDNE